MHLLAYLTWKLTVKNGCSEHYNWYKKKQLKEGNQFKIFKGKHAGGQSIVLAFNSLAASHNYLLQEDLLILKGQ